MKLSSAILTVVILLGIFSILPAPVTASEGVVQMESIDGTGGRCFVYSNLLADFNYKMLVNCRGLKYPIAQNLFQYVMWADHGDDTPTRLGSLGIGKREFSSPRAFSRLYVTKEANDQPQNPSGNNYMSGNVQALAYLEGTGVTIETVPITEVVPVPTETPAGQNLLGNFGQQQQPSPTPETEVTGEQGNLIGNAIRILGGLVVVIVVLVVIIAFISASRRRPVNI